LTARAWMGYQGSCTWFPILLLGSGQAVKN
jgi:hypothetical protein